MGIHFIKREDLFHPKISGNKFRKLKYIFKEIIINKIPVVITFGGAFSNHLAATACFRKRARYSNFGDCTRRGMEKQNTRKSYFSLIAFLKGWNLICISRSLLPKRIIDEIQKFLKTTSNYRLIPEGGTSDLGVKGCSEILRAGDADFEVICTSVGTGGTLAGLITTADSKKQTVLGFNALKNPEVLIYQESLPLKEIGKL